MSNFKDCIILFGGVSEERMVSVATTQNLARNMPECPLWFMNDKGGIHKVTSDELLAHTNPFTTIFKPKSPVAYQDIKSAVKDMSGKTIIIGMHGTEGEDGTLQKLLETNKIKFTGSGSEASSLAFDKKVTKALAKNNNLPIVTDLTLKDFSAADEIALKSFFDLHKKVVLKPLANGSSVGLFIVDNTKDLMDAFNKIQKNNFGSYLVEPFITGKEMTVGVWDQPNGKTIPMPVSEVRVNDGRNFDYDGKYLGDGVLEITPAHISPEHTKQCQELAVAMHKLVGCRGYSRTDMMLTEKGPILLEINTLPGLTKASFVPQQLDVMKVSIREFFEAQIKL